MEKEKTMKNIPIVKYLRKIIQNTIFENHLFLVGGVVRDYILNTPNKDYDLVLNIENGGIRFANWLYEKGLLTHDPVIYETYGTAMCIFKEFPNDEIELVHTRKEQYKDPNSRNPQQEYGTLEEDAHRRDLCLNALYYDITNDNIIDPTGKGLSDIENHIIRTTNEDVNIPFQEDGLRVLRCVRFASRYGWEIEEQTYQALKDNVDRLSVISQERITDEFNKMMVCNNPVMALDLLKEIGALKYVLPELIETIDCQQNKYHFGTVWQHTLKTVENTPNDLCLRISALLHDIGKIKCKTIDEKGNAHFYEHEKYSAEMVEEILRRMKYSNDFIKHVTTLVLNHMRTKPWKNDCSKMKLKTLRQMWYELGDDFDDCLTLIHADNLSHAEEYCLPNQVPIIRGKIKILKECGEDFAHYKLPINGKDVMETLHIEPSSTVKDCLKWALKFAFNKPNITKEELLKQIKQFKNN